MDAAEHTLTFAVLEDLYPKYGPVSLTVRGPIAEDALLEAITTLVTPWLGDRPNDLIHYFNRDSLQMDIYPIARNLIEKKYFVVNRWAKFYVIAFAIDRAVFPIHSSGCPEQNIDWDCFFMG